MHARDGEAQKLKKKLARSHPHKPSEKLVATQHLHRSEVDRSGGARVVIWAAKKVGRNASFLGSSAIGHFCPVNLR